MGKDDLENVTLIEHSEDTSHKGKDPIKCLTQFYKWLPAQGREGIVK